MSDYYNIDLECEFVAILLQHPDTFHDVEFINRSDLSKNYGTIYEVIRVTIENKGTPTPAVLAEKLNAIGVTFDGIETYDFLNSLLLKPVDKKGIIEISKKIKKKSLVRKIIENADKMKKEVAAAERDNKKGSEIIEIVDKYLGESFISVDSEEKTAVNLLEVIPDIIEEHGNNPENNSLIKMPYETWNNVFGGLRPGQLYTIAARQGAAKSTFLLDIMRGVNAANPDKEDLKVLYLDTEMAIQDTVTRYVAGNIGVPFHLIDSGEWRKSPEWMPLVRKGLEFIRTQKKKNLYFEAIGNIGGKDMEKLVKKWYLNVCGRGNPCLIIYDYLKINANDSKEAGNKKEYEAGYFKTEMLKDLAEYCQTPIWTALQMNRMGIVNNDNAELIDDASISISDRIGWLVAFMGIFTRRSPQQMSTDSISQDLLASTHILRHTKTRYLGKDGPNYINFVKVKEGKDIKYKPNFINFNISNFKVEDFGTYGSWIEKMGKTSIKLKEKEKGVSL